MYHQIDKKPPKGSFLRGLVVSPATFSRHMAALHAIGYRGMSMSDLEPYLRGEKRGNVFGITFDDGYKNNLQFALSILKRYRFTSTCYVVADHVGDWNRWNSDKGMSQVPLMTADDLRAWVEAGQEIGSHTLTHPNFKELDESRQEHEILQSKRLLEKLISQPQGVRHFCYPYGSFCQSSVRYVQAAGYATATTTVRGRAISPTHREDMFLLPRVLVSRTTTWMQLLLKCLTRYEDRRGIDARGSPLDSPRA